MIIILMEKLFQLKRVFERQNIFFKKFHDDISISTKITRELTSLNSNNEINLQSSWHSSWGLLKNDDKELIIKFHINDEIRIFLFDNFQIEIRRIYYSI
ncbi:hypothetical protein GLOIN_2v1609467 [Rhizophagus irregularis DAOM 181602=DAOM 197198]|uniref:Uncharacterized protein n=1 Tax=Rhizophagus irregularis (strain DAOM 181602 / DAOM 197198 / MUCL 43194) TaxID=747089 RepID=A0A2P4Q0N8_RHIID|nr:hypothetical protein GLOIN_2v1609467 [Rhizophagus irregularis DAOM 181602=DAOM 197198]POG71203.1 hypothetical protein GLOIN_2v1609467 [Rhizophagus irregularis DAOM 181602=DAOM 197198]GET63919.1 hypothetical protein GLOIN_2v1609467 [Rhizophagus irregularis DAOM 181602=DAOM 197198]|eukprot:XP_025178069.1 hypothetical protein GLOIN_2v1609467 [Rhizophagus irregularis DAOM 181602=DAOM 197198]